MKWHLFSICTNKAATELPCCAVHPNASGNSPPFRPACSIGKWHIQAGILQAESQPIYLRWRGSRGDVGIARWTSSRSLSRSKPCKRTAGVRTGEGTRGTLPHDPATVSDITHAESSVSSIMQTWSSLSSAMWKPPGFSVRQPGSSSSSAISKPPGLAGSSPAGPA